MSGESDSVANEEGSADDLAAAFEAQPDEENDQAQEAAAQAAVAAVKGVSAQLRRQNAELASALARIAASPALAAARDQWRRQHNDIAKSFDQLAAAPALPGFLEQVRRQQDETAKSLAQIMAAPAMAGFLEQVRRQQDETAKKLVQVAAAPAFVTGLYEQLVRQQSDFARSLAQVATLPVMQGVSEQLRRQQRDLAMSLAAGARSSGSAQLKAMFATLSSDPRLRPVHEHNQRVVATIERLEGAAGEKEGTPVAPELLHDEVAKVVEALSLVSDALPAEGKAATSETGAAQVFAILAALVWMSTLLGMWFDDAASTGAPPISEMTWWQMTNDVEFLISQTGGAHLLVLQILKRLIGGGREIDQ